jgi:hypothetical protein
LRSAGAATRCANNDHGSTPADGGSHHLPPQILTYLGEAGARSRPDRQGFHVFCTAAPAELRQARRAGSIELAILRGFATSNCPSAPKRIVCDLKLFEPTTTCLLIAVRDREER